MRRKKVETRAQALLESGFNCAEAVLKAVTDEVYSEPPALVPKVASCFGGRLGLVLEDRCGALSGGLLALGCLAGRAFPDEGLTELHTVALELKRRFEGRFGSGPCPGRLGPLGEVTTLCACPTVVGETAGMVYGVLEAFYGEPLPVPGGPQQGLR